MKKLAEHEEAGIYVIDDNYQIISFNEAIKKEFPGAKNNGLCYEIFCGEVTPCKNCPITHKNSKIFYGRINKWKEASWGTIAWPGAGSLNMIFLREAKTLSQLPSHISPDDCMDQLTGLFRRTLFFKSASAFLKGAAEGEFCLMSIDIEHFKLFNKWYGSEAGDQFLISIASHLRQAAKQYNGIAGYMDDDDFCIILPNRKEVLKNLQEQIMSYIKQYGDNAGFLPVFGLYAIKDNSQEVRTMYDRASMAMASVKGNYIKRHCWYDDAMIKRLEENHLLLSEIRRALNNEEFIFYLQPQCNLSTGKIVGMESLVRWNHPKRGLISPGEFIPLLESNGLITDLDVYIWDKVCQWLKLWTEAGGNALPISVNVSQIDLYTINVAECFTGLIKKYNLEPRLLEIEITESAYVEEYKRITNVVETLRMAGFTVLMDDFGSGYSSLNMLKDVNVDILKMDMKFLEMDELTMGKGVGILEAIARMARLMGLRLIAEGVENEEQLHFLLEIGCLYGQGYHFYYPMPVTEAQALLSKKDYLDFRGIKARELERLQVRALLGEDFISETVLNNIVGGIAFYDLYQGQLEILCANEQYHKVTSTNPVDLHEHRHEILEGIYEADKEAALEIFRLAGKKRLAGAEGDVRRMKSDGTTVWLHVHAYFFREQDDHQIYYASLTDITSQKTREMLLESSQRALAAVVNVSGSDEAFMKLTEENRRTAASIFAQMAPGGMIGGYCEEGFPLYFANNEMVKLLGYESYEELAAAIDGMVINTIHPEDRPQVKKDIGPHYYAGLEYTTSYRMPKKDGTWFWTLDKGRVIMAEDGRLAIVSACTDITETMLAQQQLAEGNARLLRKNQELNFLYNDMPGGYHRCADTPGYDFLFIGKRFLEIFGYTAQEIKDLFDNKFINMVHPEDRTLVSEGVRHLEKSADIKNLEYRMISKRGYIWVIDQSKYMEYENTRFLQGVILDVTETVELRNTMKLIMDYAPETMLLIHRTREGMNFSTLTNGLYSPFGFTAKDYGQWLQNKKYREVVSKEDLERLHQEIEHAFLKQENYQTIVSAVFPDGTSRWLSLDARFIKSAGDSCYYLSICRDMTSFKKKEQELWLTKRKLESILRLAEINSWDWDMESNTLTLYYIPGQSDVLSCFKKPGQEQTIIGNFPECILNHPFISSSYRDALKDFLLTAPKRPPHVSASYELPLTMPEGKVVWIRTVYETIPDSSGKPAGAVGYYLDITEQKNEIIRNMESIKALEILHRQSIYTFKVSLSDNRLSPSKELEQWKKESGCESLKSYTEMTDYICSSMILPAYREKFREFSDRNRLIERYRSGHTIKSLDYQRYYKNRPFWFRLVIHMVKFDDLPDIFAFFFVMDINRQKTQELKLLKMAETDALTGLYNRQSAIPKISRCLESLNGESAALIMFDLDNFKIANDVFGHAYGDNIIIQTAKKLKGFFRAGDIICRIGGDEFLVYCQNIEEKDMDKKLKKIIESMVYSYEDEQQEIIFSISAGYAMAPFHGRIFDDLYRKADIALFTAKLNGKSSYKQYQPDMKAIRYELAQKRSK